MRRTALLLHVVACWLLVASVIVQAVLRALDGETALTADTLVGVAALAIVVTGVIAGIRLRRTAAAFGLLLLYFGEASLAAGLQPVMALALFGAAVLYAERASGLIGRPLVRTTNLSTSGRGK